MYIVGFFFYVVLPGIARCKLAMQIPTPTLEGNGEPHDNESMCAILLLHALLQGKEQDEI